MAQKKIIVFSGAGISAESGIKTFRDSGGLWEEYDISEVATPEAFEKDPEKVLHFYNQRREQVIDSEPGEAHKAVARLEEKFDVKVVTQNIDDLHERAGSSQVLHLHGEIRKARSSVDPHLLYDVGKEGIHPGDKCDRNSQLRPHVVWFGEAVPMMEVAIHEMADADFLLIVGTSLNVYPAAGLVMYTPTESRKYLIDPKATDFPEIDNLEVIREKAGKAVPELVQQWLEKEPV